MPIEDFLPYSIFVLLMVFARVGTAILLLPGIGETYIFARSRLFLALGISIVMAPLAEGSLPPPPTHPLALGGLLFQEILVGVYIGTISRVLLLTLDTAGRIISFSSGLASAQIFNPAIATQASLPGVFLTTLGIMIILATDLHHSVILAVADSYTLFQPGQTLPLGSASEIMSRIVGDSFRVAIQLSAPFIVISLLFYVGLGLLARLMPQLQIFFVALPIQVLVGLLIFSATLTAMMTYFAEYYAMNIQAYFAPN